MAVFSKSMRPEIWRLESCQVADDPPWSTCRHSSNLSSQVSSTKALGVLRSCNKSTGVLGRRLLA